MSEMMEQERSLVASEETAAGRGEVSRAQAQVQAMVVMAHRNPRDEDRAIESIKKSCGRETLAITAVYQFPRGKNPKTGKPNLVRGPTIRLAEMLAQKWGNLEVGWRVLSRMNGSSEIEAFCWDLENNTRHTRTFHVPHVRRANGRNMPLVDPRDIYEMEANQAARRERACVLQAIPGDVVEIALDACRDTRIKAAGPDQIAKRAPNMVKAFAEYKVTEEMLKAWVGGPLDKMAPAQLVELQDIYRGLKDGEVRVEEFFSQVTPEDNGEARGSADPAAVLASDNAEAGELPPKDAAPVPDQKAGLTKEEFEKTVSDLKIIRESAHPENLELKWKEWLPDLQKRASADQMVRLENAYKMLVEDRESAKTPAPKGGRR